MKNKKSLVILLCSALLLVGSMGVHAFASGSAGTAADPVVTKSYVDAQIAEAVETLRAEAEESGPEVFTAVLIEAGKSLIGDAGTELVLRSGQASAIDNGADGVSDLTAGADLKGGTAIVRNHYLLVPRADGRGIRCTTDCWVMVKGGYTVQ